MPVSLLDPIRRFVPDAAVIVTLVPLSLLYGLACAAVVSALHRRGVAVPYTRKIFHFAVFTAASVVHLKWQLAGVMVFGVTLSLVVIAAVFHGPANPLFLALARPRDEPHRRTFILVPLVTTAMGGLVANILFPHYAYVGYLVCGWGDGVGEPVGKRWGRHVYRVPSMRGVPAERSIEGSTAVFVVGTIAAILGLEAGFGASLPHLFLLGVTAGLTGSAVEAASTHGLDNFTIQVAVAGILTLVT
jgi:phytol kinase